MQRVNFQVRVGVFNCQQILAKISFFRYLWYLWKTNRMWFSVVLVKFIIQKNAPQAKSGKYFQILFPPIWGEKMAAFWACACKLSWTLLSPARGSAPTWSGKKGDFREWTIFNAEQLILGITAYSLYGWLLRMQSFCALSSLDASTCV